MPLIAMTREMGSLGMDVARILESELKVPLVYHELINNLADKMHAEFCETDESHKALANLALQANVRAALRQERAEGLGGDPLV